jgi:hypothetical protein
MAHFKTHCLDCERLLNAPFENVNHWMDEGFRKYGPRHRFLRHHWDGVAEAAQRFGGLDAAEAAIVHIIRDCGHIPNVRDYEDGTVDVLGIGEYAPERFMYDSIDEKAFDRFRKQVEEAWERWQWYR